MSESCLFCRIARGEIPASVVYQDEEVIAFQDINPQAPTHVLIVPREHIATVDEMGAEHGPLMVALFAAAQRVGDGASYRLVFNHGADAGQTVGHVHMHLLAGRQLGWPPG
jgi:histidine triad (HIT) family protein